MRNFYSLAQWFDEVGIYFECDVDLHAISYHSSKYYDFICPSCHYKFRQQPIHITKGMGCPRCGKSKRISKAVWCTYYAFRDKCNVELEVSLGYRKSIDLYFTDFRLGIEYDGQRWHTDASKDIVKDRLAYVAGITLIHIREPMCPDVPDPTYYRISKPVTGPDGIREVIECIDSILGGGYCRTDYDKIWLEVFVDMHKGMTYNSVFEYANQYDDMDEYANDNVVSAISMPMSSNVKVRWVCRKCGYIYDCAPCNLKGSFKKRNNQGSRCPKCAGRLVNKNNSASILHPEKKCFYLESNDVSYEEITIGSTIKRKWVCEKGHIFEAAPEKVFAKNDPTWCPFCSNGVNKIMPGFNSLRVKDPFIAQFVDLAGGNSDTIAKNDKSIRRMQCPECGYIWMDSTLKMRKRTHICPNCKCIRPESVIL